MMRDEGLTREQAAEILGITKERIRSICVNRNIYGWPTGAAARDQSGSANPNFKGGVSRATINRLTKQVLLDDGRDLFTCERCGTTRNVELPRHHKDRDRSNNSPSNLEVLCVTCHNHEHLHERVRDEGGRFIG